jgi:hypothetical protein
MFINLLNLQYENYKVDFDILKVYFNHLADIQEYSIENNLEFHLIGHISLILLSNKIYRNPDDIDIKINSNLTHEWLNFFKNDWDWCGSVENAGRLHLFLENKLSKFASRNINNCAMVENEADLYKINDKQFLTYSHSQSTNLMDGDIYARPQFICHDPEKNFFDDKPFIEIKKNTFKIWFYTNSVEQYFKSFIIFYEDNLKHQKIIECGFRYDYKVDNEIYAIWSSPELNLEEFNRSYYRILIQKDLFAVRLKNKITKVILELYLKKENLTQYSAPIIFNENDELNPSIGVIFNNKPLKVAYPSNCLRHKYGRKKDIDDYKIYGHLLDKYPLTNP